MNLLNTKEEKLKNKIYKVLSEQNFIVGDAEKQIIKARIKTGRRYFFMVCDRNENGNIISRFIKIPANNTKKLLLPFERQILFSNYLREHTELQTRGVISSNVNVKRGVPFAIMETFPVSHSKIGFIEGDKGSELLTRVEAENVVSDLVKLHRIQIKSLPSRLQKILRDYRGDFKSFYGEISRFLNKKVKPVDVDNKKEESFHYVLERRLGIEKIKEKILRTIKYLEPIIDSQKQESFLLHGDMAPNNLYVFDSGKVELLDIEWVGKCKNEAISMIIDFGNLRARSWNNKIFREALDEALIKSYKDAGREELGKAIVCLSILRSHLQLAGFFENYDWQKQKTFEQKSRLEATESDIVKVWRMFP